MITRVIAKAETQKMIKALRAAGLTVEKNGMAYTCEVKGRVVFKALNGQRGYLVRMAENLFV